MTMLKDGAALRTALLQIIPVLILLFGLTLTFVLSVIEREKLIQSMNHDLGLAAQETIQRIRNRLEDYAEALSGGRGFFNGSDTVSRRQWHEYVQALNLGITLPGIQGLGYSKILTPAEKDAFVESVRREGFQDFVIRPEGVRSIYTTIIYLEPFEGRNLRAFGYDMYSDQTRRVAMDAATDGDAITISGKVKLVQETDAEIPQAGFLMYVPVYRNGVPHQSIKERRENLQGWVYAPFRMNDFIRSVIGSGLVVEGVPLDIAVFDGDHIDTSSAMFRTGELSDPIITDSGDLRFAFRQTLTFGNHTWTITVNAPIGYDGGRFDDKVELIMVSGGGISLLITFVSWFLVWGRGARVASRRSDAVNMAPPPVTREAGIQAIAYALATAMTVVVGYIVVITDNSDRHARMVAERTSVENQLNLIRLRLERALTAPMVLTRGMAAQIIAHGDVTPDEFSKVAEVIVRGYPAIMNIAVSHGTRVDFIYPMAGNEPVIGADFRKVGWQWPLVKRTIETRSPIVQGPIPLIQGGYGLVIRDPVFLADGQGGENRLFGLVSIALKIPVIFAEAGLDQADLPVMVAVRGQDGLGEAGGMIKGDATIFSSQPVEMDAEFPYGKWRLAAIPRNGWGAGEPIFTVSRLLEGAFFLFVAFVSFGTARYTVDRRRLLYQVGASEERFRRLLEIASDGVHVLDEHGNLVMWSASFLKMLGFTEEEAATLNVSDWEAVYGREQLLPRIQELLSQPGMFETKHRRRDGAIIDVEINAGGIKLGGRPYLYASSRDITERKTQDSVIRRQAEIIRQAPAAIIVTDLQGYVIEWNVGAETLHGYPEHEVVGKHIELLVPDDERASHRSRIMEPLLEHGQVTVEIPSLRRDRTIIWIELTLWMLRDERGAPISLVGYSVDITARRQADAALKESGARLKLALNAADMGVWEWRIATGELYWTPECQTIFGSDKLSGTVQDFLDRVYPEDAAALLAAAGKAVADGTSYAMDFRILHRNGEIRWLSHHGRTDYDAGGKAVRMVGTVQDITVRKTHEAMLLEARRQADQANAAKSDFLAMMSHEIRTPITGVLGMADLLLRTPLNDEQASYVKTLGASAKILLGILNDILDISKIEAGKVLIESVAFDIRSTVRDVLEMGCSTASAKGLPLDCDLADDIPVVIGDPTRVKQVVFNLVSNAIKFTEKGKITVRTTVIERSTSAVRVLFEVRDTGIGITREQMDRLFEAFSQADQTTTRRFGGTGLGLAISKRLLELMGGTIGVDSEPGTGTTFRFELPFGVASQTETHSPRLPATSAPEVQDQQRPLRILLAEDNRINRMLVCAMLKKFGHVVTAVENGRQAVDAVTADDYDVVLMDMQMPEMDGECAFRRSRALKPIDGGQLFRRIAGSCLAAEGA